MLAKSPNSMNSNNKQGKRLGSFEIPRHFRIFSWLSSNLSIKVTDLADSFCESWVNSETIPQSIFTQYSSFEIMGLLKKNGSVQAEKDPISRPGLHLVFTVPSLGQHKFWIFNITLSGPAFPIAFVCTVCLYIYSRGKNTITRRPAAAATAYDFTKSR